ncbi:DNA polymerase III subunit gamma/tau [Thermosipho atlanticus]|uniref:DNA polymerase III subunit gamma/tau n=1 Tax=Thermosipho atlanticus DSM 15807 TaxID=1123380 RepID=A0A1M5R053_9BACT|nr:DNA polymerase III subunit gamma/tau [Thermosipho atlanticus]SHH19420.1 DNA polymerase-3 subunit gamma/tau [Thermosipho atlanticus DSM 15807]
METLYRKYRPKTFSEVIGQEHVKRLFINSLKNNMVSHAYIFAGPRGTGKTTVARILAKSLNCENRIDIEPCNKCSSCISIDNGNFMDVYEIDAASNRGIDEIRKIRDTVGYHTAQGKYKIYIIDEAHMLTKEAFNALLKTLEEPPQNVIFILATTNPEKIPTTIISRCQVIDFKNIELNKIVERLKYISEKEGFDITNEALHEIAIRANGGLRDALTILEQVVRFASEKVTVDTVKETLGMISEEIIKKLLEAIRTGNIKQVLNLVEEIYFSGKDIELFLNQILEHIILKVQNGDLSEIDLLKPISLILKDIKYSDEKFLLVKLGLIELSKNYISKPLENNLDQKNNLKEVQPTNSPSNGNTPEIKDIINKSSISNSANNDLKVLENEGSIINEIIEELKIKGDLSLYVGLSFAKIEETNNEIIISFPPDKKIQLEIVKSKIDVLEKFYLTKAGIRKTFIVKTEDNNETDQVLKKLKAIFGNNYTIEE